MADSKRHQITDAVVSAVATVSSIFVSEKIQHWEEVQKKNYPIVAFLTEGDEQREPFSLMGGAGDEDMRGILPLTLTCYCYNATNSRDALKQLRTDLIRDIHKALWGGTALMSLVLDLRDNGTVGEGGVVPNYSLFDINVEVEYLYNHLDGG